MMDCHAPKRGFQQFADRESLNHQSSIINHQSSITIPLVPWGDASVTVIFAVGMFAMIRWPARLQLIAALTLALVSGYIGVRGVIAG